MTVAQQRVLVLLEEHSPLTVTQIAELMGVNQSNASRHCSASKSSVSSTAAERRTTPARSRCASPGPGAVRWTPSATHAAMR